LLSSVSTAYPKPVFGAFGFEISGVAMFLASLFVLYYGLQLVPSRGRRVALSSAAAIGLTAILFAFVALDRDVWTPPTQGVVKIGVIVPTTGPYAMLGNPSINNHVKALKVEVARLALTVADEQRFDGAVRDFRSLIGGAAASGPDVYYVEALEPGLDLLGQQLADARIHNV
jgi:hypothetical protein